jgi:hypothetical protein
MATNVTTLPDGNQTEAVANWEQQLESTPRQASEAGEDLGTQATQTAASVTDTIVIDTIGEAAT